MIRLTPSPSPLAERGEEINKKVFMNVKQKARQLRKNQTLAEKIFWKTVKNRKVGLKIVRQKPIMFDYLCNTHIFYADFLLS